MSSLDVAGGRLPRLHVVTDDAILARPDFEDQAGAVLSAGGSRVAMHIRGPRTAGRALFSRAEAVARVAATTHSWVVVNDRIDVALAVGARAVHLGRRSMPIEDTRRLLPPGVAIGVSIHEPGEGADAAVQGADFLFAGTLYRSASHPERPGSGLRWLRELAGGPPVIGIGGIGIDRVEEVLRAGAYGVAAIRAVWEAESPERAVTDFLDRLG